MKMLFFSCWKLILTDWNKDDTHTAGTRVGYEIAFASEIQLYAHGILEELKSKEFGWRIPKRKLRK